jgi:hypothetical protein
MGGGCPLNGIVSYYDRRFGVGMAAAVLCRVEKKKLDIHVHIQPCYATLASGSCAFLVIIKRETLVAFTAEW